LKIEKRLISVDFPLPSVEMLLHRFSAISKCTEMNRGREKDWETDFVAAMSVEKSLNLLSLANDFGFFSPRELLKFNDTCWRERESLPPAAISSETLKLLQNFMKS
jgi:hypothetical protein